MINGVGKTNGCTSAPEKVLKKLKERGSSYLGKGIEFDKLNLEEIHVDINKVKKSNSLIYKNSLELFKNEDRVLFVGGDHSITYSIAKAFFETEEDGLLIVFDAHVDCVSVDQEPVNGEWLARLIDGGISGERIVLVSCRNIWGDELKFIKKNNITWVKMDVLREDVTGICEMLMERATKSSGFYVSIDIDCVDPAFAPGVSYLEPGGLSSRDLIYFIQRLKILKNFKGADIVEINPDHDINGVTVKLGAVLLGEMVIN